MKKISFVLHAVCLLIICLNAHASGGKEIAGWKAGVAHVMITPQESMWMAGYASRDHPSEGKIQDLWAKALALEDANGKRCILITTDLCAIPKDFSDRIRDQLKINNNLSRDQIIINCSHTHSGPVIENSLTNIYPLDEAQGKKIKKYTEELEKKIVALAASAFKSMEPVEVFSENGLARFQVNRRNNNEPSLLFQEELKGPNDYAVPVIKVINKTGSIIAIAFGYACHNT
ncbi:MAG: neutral/alkaline non-lysosomal ceramidase N-terminal domain-containing protein, partial [Ginsengibacter sp.]